ncbi:hypothetical protein, partial [Pseudorhodobacter sp.]|uniref:hypothetical protein n=1 Tax=Pseudorhodobacter sp. TaxID=1934400 RepID=UPI00264733D7
RDIPCADLYGYPAVFGLRMHRASVLASSAVHWIDPTTIRAVNAKFRAVIWPRDRILSSGVVQRKYRDEQRNKSADIPLWCRHPDQTIVAEVDTRCVFDAA